MKFTHSVICNAITGKLCNWWTANEVEFNEAVRGAVSNDDGLRPRTGPEIFWRSGVAVAVRNHTTNKLSVLTYTSRLPSTIRVGNIANKQ